MLLRWGSRAQEEIEVLRLAVLNALRHKAPFLGPFWTEVLSVWPGVKTG